MHEKMLSEVERDGFAAERLRRGHSWGLQRPDAERRGHPIELNPETGDVQRAKTGAVDKR